MIEFNQVSKVYPGNHTALDNVSFSIQSGEMVFLTGHSGAGKSTLLKLIACLEQPSSGQIVIAGCNARKFTDKHVPALRQRLGLIFQDPMLLDDRNVFENVAIPLRIAGYRPQDIKKRVQAALVKVDLLAKIHAMPATLSCGEQQRVGIARAVVNRPQILLADEPTGNLDPKLSNDMMRLFEQFREVGVVVLIATHDLHVIQSYHHRIMTLDKGELVSDGCLETQEVFA